MAEKISDNINKIVKEVNGLKTQAREASNETRKLNETLKLDPTNAELVKQRISALMSELSRYHKQMTVAAKYEAELRKQSDVGTKQLSQLQKGTKEYDKLEKELRSVDDAMQKVHSASEKAESQVKRLQAALRGIKAKAAADDMAAAEKQTKKLEQSMNNLQKVGNKLAVVFGIVSAGLRKMFNSAFELGTELYTLSKRYRTNAENIQYWNRALQLATGESELFTKSLQVMSKGLSTILVGRGVAYNNALRGIGVSFKEIRDLDPTAQFETIIEGLRNVADESLLGSYAIQLFGDSGQTIASALSDTNGEFDKYLEQAKEFSFISQENAEQLANMSFKLEAVKSKMQVASAMATINFAPALLRLYELGNKLLLPLVTGLTKGSWALWVVIIALIGLKLVPAVIQWVIALRAAKKAHDDLTISALATKAALLGVVGVFGLIAFGIGSAAIAAEKANKEFADFANTANDLYGGYSSSLGANVEQIYSSSNEKTVNINVEIEGHGDLPMGDANATTVAQLTVDQVQKVLGDLINNA